MAGACGATGAMADCCAHARGAQSRIAATASILVRPILAPAAFSGGQSRLKAGWGQNCPPYNLGEGGVGHFMGAPPWAGPRAIPMAGRSALGQVRGQYRWLGDL